MSHRTQITLSDAQYDLLRRESRERGVPLAELIRRAIDGAYGETAGPSEAALVESFGAWTDRDFDGATYVERLRRPGLGRRLRS
jgi:hypothetical protein